jgi:hypothetical protein
MKIRKNDRISLKQCSKYGKPKKEALDQKAELLGKRDDSCSEIFLIGWAYSLKHELKTDQGGGGVSQYNCILKGEISKTST